MSRYCGSNDIITPISSIDEELRKDEGLYPINFLKSYNELNLKEKFNYHVRKKTPFKYYNHMPAEEVKNFIGNDKWHDYFKFSIDRNPWDKVVSLYHYEVGKSKQELTFAEWFKKGNYAKAYNYPLYSSSNGEILLDYICNYENLNEELQFIQNKLDFDIVSFMPRAKSEFRTNKKDLSSYYNSEMSYIVTNYFKNEIDLHGYEKPFK